jgi:hypothetical protein
MKPVDGYAGIYSVTREGMVYSHRGGRFLRLSLDNYGYRKVSLQVDCQRKTPKVHRLVAMAFLPNPNNLPLVNHKDLNKQNNTVDNLEWCDHKHNTRHAAAAGATLSFRRRKLSESDLIQIRELSAAGAPINDIARLIGVSYGCIHAFLNGRTYHEFSGQKEYQ